MTEPAKHPTYRATCDRAVAEKVLENQDAATYLVRPGSRNGTYVISFMNTQNEVKHFSMGAIGAIPDVEAGLLSLAALASIRNFKPISPDIIDKKLNSTTPTSTTDVAQTPNSHASGMGLDEISKLLAAAPPPSSSRPTPAAQEPVARASADNGRDRMSHAEINRMLQADKAHTPPSSNHTSEAQRPAIPASAPPRMAATSAIQGIAKQAASVTPGSAASPSSAQNDIAPTAPPIRPGRN